MFIFNYFRPLCFKSARALRFSSPFSSQESDKFAVKMQTGQQLISANGHSTNEQSLILFYLLMSSWITTSPNALGKRCFFIFLSWELMQLVTKLLLWHMHDALVFHLCRLGGLCYKHMVLPKFLLIFKHMAQNYSAFFLMFIPWQLLGFHQQL